MKWTRPHKSAAYQISEDGKWIVNRVFVCGVANYALVRLGKRIVTRNGAEMWEGSQIVATGSKAECLAALEGSAHETES